MGTSGAGSVGGSRETEARLKIQDIFSQSKAPNAGTINIVLQNKDNKLEVATLAYDPQMAVHLRSNTALQGRELDPKKLEAAGIKGVQPNASYYAFPDFAKAIVQNYNSAMGTGTTLYNQLSSELGYTDRLDTSSPVRDISQINDFQGWRQLSDMLEGAQREAAKIPGSVSRVLTDQIDPAQQALASAGGNAIKLSEFHFDRIKPYAPGMEVPAFNYDSLLPDRTGSGAGGGPRPQR
ncbi:MAG: hypothetical protein IPH06_01070 [Alphaproteobacteria bacterium]|nr:hypothetical protein [Alphaproteobacteria bacterium]QQS56659.1 MAG: hypothetical protein IPN28_10325 [Alphaproteobacteria bacterium]